MTSLWDVRDKTTAKEIQQSALKLLEIMIARNLCDSPTKSSSLTPSNLAEAVAKTYRGSRAQDEVWQHLRAVRAYRFSTKSAWQSTQYFFQRLINDEGVRACDECGAVHQFDPYKCRLADPDMPFCHPSFEGFEHRIFKCSCGVNHMHVMTAPPSIRGEP